MVGLYYGDAVVVFAGRTSMQDKMEAQLAEGRNEIRSCFRDASNVIELEYDKATDTWIEKNINPHIKQIDHDIEEINNNIDTANEHYVKLSNLLQRVNNHNECHSQRAEGSKSVRSVLICGL